jgi:hypothetical protein
VQPGTRTESDPLTRSVCLHCHFRSAPTRSREEQSLVVLLSKRTLGKTPT